jgi:hypothetical protein
VLGPQVLAGGASGGVGHFAIRRGNDVLTLVAQGADPRVYRREQHQVAVVAAEITFASVFQRWRDFKALSLE